MFKYTKPELELRADSGPLIVYSDEQHMLADTANKFCREKSDFASARELMNSATGFSSSGWKELAELGWPGLVLPEEFGGSGLSLAELVPLVEATGRSLMHTPLQAVTTAALVLNRSGTQEQKQQWLPRIVEGGIVTLALSDANHWDYTKPECTATRSGDTLTLRGSKNFVADFAEAEAVIATVSLDGAAALVLIPRDKIADSAATRQVVMDEIKRCHKISLDGIELPASHLLSVGDATATIRFGSLAATLLVSAEMVGGQAACIDLLVEYLNTRKTFGRLIGSYQGLKHPMADMLCHYEDGRSLLYRAATVFRADPDSRETEIAVRMTKSFMSDKFLYAGDRAVQFHGGIGFTWECNAQLFLRRAVFAQSQFGDGIHQRKHLADLMLGTVEDILAA